MNYYYDTEFLEGAQKKWFGKTKPTIDLISIGIVSEDGREYYAISKDFNLKEAWNKNDLDPNHKRNYKQKDNYWIRENVLKPIFQELLYSGYKKAKLPIPDVDKKQFTYKNLKKLIQSFGKTNKQIAQEVKNFCYSDKETRDGGGQFVSGSFLPNKYPTIKFYGYYSAYDHVALCWLFGKMIDLPKGFPMYTIDLKQIMDEKVEDYSDHFSNGNESFKTKLSWIKNKDNYPKQTNEHNALADAKWNKELHNFLNKL